MIPATRYSIARPGTEREVGMGFVEVGCDFFLGGGERKRRREGVHGLLGSGMGILAGAS